MKSTKKNILETFDILLEKKEFSKITFKDISEKSGYSRRTIYRYFSSRNSILDHILDLYKKYLINERKIDKITMNDFLFFLKSFIFEDEKEEVKLILSDKNIKKKISKYFSNSIYEVIKNKTINNQILCNMFIDTIFAYYYEWSKNNIDKKTRDKALENLLITIEKLID